jgi:hypothetical protein
MMSSLQPCVARLKALARVVDGDTLDLDKRTAGAWPCQALHPLSHRLPGPGPHPGPLLAAVERGAIGGWRRERLGE